MFESKNGVLLIGGVFFFVLAFVIMGALPWTIYAGEGEEDIAAITQDGLIHEFVDLVERYPAQFEAHFGKVTDAEGRPDYEKLRAAYGRALSLGRDVYVAEACWHCHSQQIRPVANEDIRWGPVSHAKEYLNELQRPVLFGTRRVGPDLVREGARRGNDWHAAHFYKPTSVSPLSVMPEYPWFFDAEGYPNERGFAIITYVQWLGSWMKEYPYFMGEGPPGTRVLDPEPKP